MNNKGWLIFNILINRYAPQKGESILMKLPPQERQKAHENSTLSSDLEAVLEQPQRVLEWMHYSWVKPALTKFSPALQPTVIALLPKEHRLRLKGGTTQKPCPVVKAYLLHQLSQLLHLDEHLPIEFLPESELTPLLQWKKPQLIDLIDFLGIHDLSSEVRHIVNRNHLNNIYKSLTPRQLAFLKVCLHQKERVTSPKLNIDPSQLDQERIRKVIHHRGLARLGKALYGQHPDFVWTLAHRLDLGRGEILLKVYHPQALPKITQILKQQVVATMNFLKVSSP